MERLDREEYYEAVVEVRVSGYGKPLHKKLTIDRIEKELKLQFGAENVTVIPPT